MSDTRFQTFFNRWLAAKKLKPYQVHAELGIAIDTAYSYSNGMTFPRKRKALVLAKAMRLSAKKRATMLRILSLDRMDNLGRKRSVR